MISTSDFEKGLILNLDSQPWLIVDISFMSPGKGGAVYRTKLKNLKSGNFIERTFKSGEEFKTMELTYKKAAYLYSDRRNSVFLADDKQRISLPLEMTADKIKYIKQNSEVKLMYVDAELLAVEIPIKVDLKVTEAEQAAKGNTATNVPKKIKVETGLELNAPMFIKAGDIIRINTETGEYVERASN
ncbi:MAG: elongation factor P [Patescibacteria group bacterium]